MIHFEGVLGYYNPDYKSGVEKIVHKKQVDIGKARFMIIKSMKNFFKALQKTYILVLLMPSRERIYVDLAEEIWKYEGDCLSSIYMLKEGSKIKRLT